MDSPPLFTNTCSFITHCEPLSSQSLAWLSAADVSPRAVAGSDWFDRDEIYSAPQLILSSHGWVSKKNRGRDR